MLHVQQQHVLTVNVLAVASLGFCSAAACSNSCHDRIPVISVLRVHASIKIFALP